MVHLPFIISVIYYMEQMESVMRKVSLKVEAIVDVYINDPNDAPQAVELVKKNVDFWPTSHVDSVEIDGFRVVNISNFSPTEVNPVNNIPTYVLIHTHKYGTCVHTFATERPVPSDNTYSYGDEESESDNPYECIQFILDALNIDFEPDIGETITIEELNGRAIFIP